MMKAWKQLDLEGEGLQTLNARYTRQMRRRRIAYAAMLLFPLGAHRWYLREPRGASAYLALTAAAAIGATVFGRIGFAVPAVAATLFAAFDLYWVEQRVVSLNKALRMRQFIRPGMEPPKDYRGRYPDDGLDEYVRVKDRERAGHQPVGEAASDRGNRQRAPSFNEQEALLRELSRSNKGRRKPDSQ